MVVKNKFKTYQNTKFIKNMVIKMINVYVKGRLGNQMFQYAAARGIQEKYYPNELINMNFKYVVKDGKKKKETGWNNQLTGFNLNKSVKFDEKVKLNIDQIILLIFYFLIFKTIKLFSKDYNYYSNKKKFENKIQKFYNKRGLYLYSYGYYDFKFSKRKNKLMIGYFESDKYFNNIKEKLIYEFSSKLKKLEKNEDIYKNALKKNSVCISIRRGDFLTSNNAYDCVVCDKKYFKKALIEIEKKLMNYNLIIFSDDIEWVKNNMFFGTKNTVYEKGNDNVYEKLRMMSMCNNFIISNSTFSWWAQYLSKNKTKIVIGPSKWRNTNISLYNDIYEKDWILI